jgi:hypothetical protein
MAAVAGALFLMEGCARQLDLAPKTDEVIGFSAGSRLLRDDATKGGTPKEGTEFGSGDTFFVFGCKVVSDAHQQVFSGDEVSYDGSQWSYEPLRFWDSNASRYDFIAFSGPASNDGISFTIPAHIHADLSAMVTYDATGTQCDLMTACSHRSDGTVDPVELEFKHMLSAVSVTIYNDSPHQDITLNSYRFRYLCTRATAYVEQDLNTPIIPEDWFSPSYNSNLVLGSATGADLAHGGSHYPASASYDLMIPQELDQLGAYIPRLVVDYSFDPGTGEEHVTTPIRLQDIKAKNSEEYITRWLPGVRYNYEVHIRVGGGIRVVVSTTDWEDVYAQTPGLAI